MKVSITKSAFPICQLTLSRGETARIQKGSMIFHDDTIDLTAHLNAKKGSRGFGKILSTVGRSIASGESSLITEIKASTDDSRCGIASSMPGTIKTLNLDEDQYFINDGAFLAMSQEAGYEMHRQKLVKGFLSNTGGMFIMETSGYGKIVVNGFGSIVALNLNDQELTIDNDHVVAWSTALDYNLHFENGFWQSGFTGEGLVNTFSGSGKIYLQSLSMPNFASQLIPYLPSNND